MLETLSFIGFLTVIPYLWTVIIAFMNSQYVWGVLMIVFYFPSFIYGIVHWDKAKVPFMLGVFLWILLISTFWSNIDEIIEMGYQEEMRFKSEHEAGNASDSGLSEWKN